MEIRPIYSEKVTIAASICRLNAELRRQGSSGRTCSANSLAVPFHRPPVCRSIMVKSKSRARRFMFCFLSCFAAASHLSSMTGKLCRLDMSNANMPLFVYQQRYNAKVAIASRVIFMHLLFLLMSLSSIILARSGRSLFCKLLAKLAISLRGRFIFKMYCQHHREAEDAMITIAGRAGGGERAKPLGCDTSAFLFIHHFLSLPKIQTHVTSTRRARQRKLSLSLPLPVSSRRQASSSFGTCSRQDNDGGKFSRPWCGRGAPAASTKKQRRHTKRRYPNSPPPRSIINRRCVDKL